MEKLNVQTMPLAGVHLVESAAGTGKTHNITLIVMRLLMERRLSVQQVLVVTFTRAAAQELRGRIAESLDDAMEVLQSDEADAWLSNFDTDLTVEDARLLVMDALHNLDEAPIYTIHAFAQRVLAEHAMSVGIPMDVNLEADTRALVLGCIEDAYRRVAMDSSKSMALQGRWSTPRDFYAALGGLLSEQTELQVESLASLEAEKNAARDAVLAAESMLRADLVDCHKMAAEREVELVALLDFLQADLDAPMPKAAKSFMNGNRYRKRDDLKALFQPVKALEKMPARAEAARAMAVAAEMIPSLREAVWEEKRRRRVMGFDDLVRVLDDALSGEGCEALIEKVRAQFPVALIDEFQDTDREQYRVFKQLFSAPENMFCMIGDAKQSVYAFRGGDVYAYLMARQDADYSWYMDTNYRSSEAVLDGYNAMFNVSATKHGMQDVFGPGINYTQIGYAGALSKSNQKPLHDMEPRGGLQVVKFPDPDVGKTLPAEFRGNMAEWCAREVTRLLMDGSSLGDTPVAEADIAFLVRDRGEANEVRRALANEGLNSVYLSARENVFWSDEAEAMRQVMRGILSPEDNKAFTRALVSRMIGLSGQDILDAESDDTLDIWQERFAGWKALWERQGWFAVGQKLLQDHFLPDPERRERSITNVRHLIELVQAASRSAKSPLQQLNWLEERLNDPITPSEAELRLESDQSLIRVVTQHGSKGLQYPIVFVPFPTRGYKHRSSDVQRFHDEDGASVVQLGANAHAAERASKEAMDEQARLLYVAVTRAIDRCYLCVAALQDQDKSPLARLLGCAGTEIPEVFAQLQSEVGCKAVNVMEDHQLTWSEPYQRKAVTGVMEPREFTGRLKVDWGVRSFSQIASELKRAGISEQLELSRSVSVGTRPMRFRFTAGVRAGTALHGLLQEIDYQAPQLDYWVDRLAGSFPQDLASDEDEQGFKTWMNEVFSTPLLSGQYALADLNPASMLREAEFYFSVGDATLDHVLELLQSHRGMDEPLGVSRRQLKGMMNGSMDLVFEAGGKYYVNDHKSNHLGDRLEDYGIRQMQREVQGRNYDLQGLIYSVALHRYLKLTLSGYQPEQHLGGVVFSFLRGMDGSGTTGVYHDEINPNLVIALDEIFSGEARGAGARAVASA